MGAEIKLQIQDKNLTCRIDLDLWVTDIFVCGFTGDVLSGTWLGKVHHLGVVEEWFGQHWWSTRYFLLLLTTLFVFTPLISFKRVG